MDEARNQRTGLFYDWARWLYPLVEPFLSSARRRLVERVNAEPGGKLLDIGVGTGAHLGSYQGREVTGVDVSPGMVRMARRHAARAGVEVCEMDGERLAFADASFDGVVLAFVLSVTAQPEKLLAEALRVLRPGGRMFILNHETPAAPPRWFPLLRRLLHLHPCFTLAGIPGWPAASVVHRESCGPRGCFMLVILQK